MRIKTTNAEAKLMEEMKALRSDPSGWYAVHFHTSKLQEQYRSEFQIRIAINVLNDVFRTQDGYICAMKDFDIVLLYKGDDKNLLDKALFQLRYLYVDDPIAHNEDGSENEDFATIYDLVFQWRNFYEYCEGAFGQHTRSERQGESEPKAEEPSDRVLPFTPHQLAVVCKELEDVDVSLIARHQPICAITRDKQVKPVFSELYMHIHHLRQMLSQQTELTSDPWLFRYLTQELDVRMLKLLADRAGHYFKTPISLNLNIKTILSKEFEEFCERTKQIPRRALIVEMSVADVFVDMGAFMAAKQVVQGHGFRVCLDGLTRDSIVQVDREMLGVDLEKLAWNADLASDLKSAENKALKSSIRKSGANRIILCRCDSPAAIDYGHALGIALFQGRTPDAMIDPNAPVKN